MFIVFEAISTNDPLWIPDLKRFNNFWNYVIAEISEDKKNLLDLQGLKADIISETLARSSMLAGQHDGKITVKPNTLPSEILFDSESGHPNDTKVYYHLTEEDQKNTVDFIKIVLKNYSTYHAATTEDKNNFDSEVEACKTIDQCNWVMYNYLDVTHYNTSGTKTSKFFINWK
jgi:hypothetical protein